jgi:phosphatidate cytidylyltransferase
MLFGLAMGLWVLELSPWHGVAAGVLIAMAATLGDLGESLIKRGTGVKDTGSIIPGHGGMLDRLDSLIFTGPLVYYYMLWVT